MIVSARGLAVARVRCSIVAFPRRSLIVDRDFDGTRLLAYQARSFTTKQELETSSLSTEIGLSEVAYENSQPMRMVPDTFALNLLDLDGAVSRQSVPQSAHVRRGGDAIENAPGRPAASQG